MTELNSEVNTDSVNGAAANGLNGMASAANAAILVSAAAGPDQARAIVLPAEAKVSAPPPEAKATGPADVRVADIRKNQHDSRGEKIDFVFYRRRDFAIYRSGGKIIVQYSDDETVAKTQVANIAELLPLRSRLQYLVRDLAAPNAYHWQIAEALRLGLDGQKDAARTTMQVAIDNVIARRVSQGRDTYLIFAGIAVLTVVSCLIAAALIPYPWALIPEDVAEAVKRLMMATGSGALGAMLSTAMAFRARTMAVATDVDLRSNAVDSATRVMIGVISAAVLYLILDTNLLGVFSVAGMSLKADQITWKIAALVGFAAGFLERLVPDLLEKKLTPATK